MMTGHWCCDHCCCPPVCHCHGPHNEMFGDAQDSIDDNDDHDEDDDGCDYHVFYAHDQLEAVTHSNRLG